MEARVKYITVWVVVYVYIKLGSIYSFKLREREVSATRCLCCLFIRDYFIDVKIKAVRGVRARGGGG